MSHIKLSDLSVKGSNLFEDSESFLEDLSNQQQLLAIRGGDSIISQVTVSAGLLVAPEQAMTIDATPLSIGLSDTESTTGIFLV